MAKILIIEDDVMINEMLGEALLQDGHECTSAYSGTEGILRLQNKAYDLILLDLMLPGMPGEEVLKKAKELTKAPVIIASAKDELDTKVDLLTLGAEDYITKPFELKEVKARIMVQLRRGQKAEDTALLQYKKLKLDKDSAEVTIEGEKLTLTRQEYRILELLLSNPKRVFSKQEIYDYAWEEYYIGEDKTINVHISNIRHKIKKITSDSYIETVWGIGFKL